LTTPFVPPNSAVKHTPALVHGEMPNPGPGEVPSQAQAGHDEPRGCQVRRGRSRSRKANLYRIRGLRSVGADLRIYAITSAQIPDETLDLFLTRGAAEAELAEILEDEPGWASILSVVPIELDERDVSPN